MAEENAGSDEGGDSSPWANAGLDETQTGYITNKGWESPAMMLASYQALETHNGVPADRLIKLPAADDEAADWSSVYTKLGRPENADGYGDLKLPDGAVANEDRTKAFKTKAHELGLTPKQLAGLATWDAEFGMGLAKSSGDASALKHETEMNALKTEWGEGFDAQFVAADRAAAEFGLTVQDVVDMKGLWGGAKAAKFLASIGAKMGEATFELGEGRQFGSMTPGAATAKIAELNSDAAFMSRYLSGDEHAVNQMNSLHALKTPPKG